MEVVKQARLAYLDLINLNCRLSRRRQLLQVLDSMLRKVVDVEMRAEFNVLEISKMKIDAFDIASISVRWRYNARLFCRILFR